MSSITPKIAIVELGHVGLPTALGFAELGFHVVGADDDPVEARQIAQGRMPFFEPGLDERLRRHLAQRRFTVADTVPEAMRAAEILFVCVGTPQREDGSADMAQIGAVSRAIARNLNGYKLVVEKSTSQVLIVRGWDRQVTYLLWGSVH